MTTPVYLITDQDMNTIMEALGAQPWSKVNVVIGNLLTQANSDANRTRRNPEAAPTPVPVPVKES